MRQKRTQGIARNISEKIEYIDLRAIRLNQLQSTSFLDRDTVEKLAGQILETGLLKEPIGRRMPENPVLVELADGVHRFHAFKLNNERFPNGGWGVMPVKIIRVDDRTFYRTQWLGNDHRRMSALEKGRWLLRMQDQLGLRQVDLEEISGMSQQSISDYIGVARAPQWLAQAVHTNLIGLKRVPHLRDLPEEQGQELVTRLRMAAEDRRNDIVRQAISARGTDFLAGAAYLPVNVCPCCGRTPKTLLLDETQHHYVCDHCGRAIVARLKTYRSGRPKGAADLKQRTRRFLRRPS